MGILTVCEVEVHQDGLPVYRFTQPLINHQPDPVHEMPAWVRGLTGQLELWFRWPDSAQPGLWTRVAAWTQPTGGNLT